MSQSVVSHRREPIMDKHFFFEKYGLSDHDL